MVKIDILELGIFVVSGVEWIVYGREASFEAYSGKWGGFRLVESGELEGRERGIGDEAGERWHCRILFGLFTGTMVAG